jgi:hypothetical protein
MENGEIISSFMMRSLTSKKISDAILFHKTNIIDISSIWIVLIMLSIYGRRHGYQYLLP